MYGYLYLDLVYNLCVIKFLLYKKYGMLDGKCIFLNLYSILTN